MERMSDINTHTTETTERKPPTIAEIVREKTGDGALIIDFFTDVMTGRIKGAELCHRMDAAKELVKFGSAEAVIFIAKYKGIPCGHSTRRRRDSADSCIAEERTQVEVTLNAPAALTREFLTVLSGIDEFLMRRLIRAQTADGGTIIDFLDDVMQDRNEGFKTHHRLAAAKELIVHIIRDEQCPHTPSPTPAVGADPRVRPLPGSKTPSPSTAPSPSTEEGGARPESPRRGEGDSPTPSPSTGEGWGEGDSPVVPAHTTVVPAQAGTQRSGGPGATRPSRAGVNPEPSSPVVPAHTIVVPAQAGTQRSRGPGATRPSKAGVHPEPSSSVVPAQAGTHPRTVAIGEPAPEQPGADTQPPSPEPAEGRQDDKARRPRTRRTRTQRRRDGNARAAALRKGSERIEEEKDEKPALVELTIAERRIREKLEQHWHEPDPWAGPIDSTTPSRSPP